VRVATFSINNFNERLDNLLAWLAKAEPDVVSLQELKAEQKAFPMNDAGYIDKRIVAARVVLTARHLNGSLDVRAFF
jgi:exonuclease III